MEPWTFWLGRAHAMTSSCQAEKERLTKARSATPTRRTRCFSPWAQRVLPGEFPLRGRSIQAGSLCYTNRCPVEVVARLDAPQHLQTKGLCLVSSSHAKDEVCFSPWAQRVLPGELPPRGRSIQAGSLCYTNRCPVEVVAQLDASSAPPARRTGLFIFESIAPPEHDLG